MNDAKSRIRYLFLQPVPANTPPSTWIVHVDQAMLAGFGVWALIHFALGFLLWRSMPGIPELPDVGTNALHQLLHYPATLLGQIFSLVMLPPWPTYAWIDNPLYGNALALNLRLMPGFLLGLWAGIFVFSRGLTPWRNLRWVEGHRLLEGQEAVQAALQASAQERATVGLEPKAPGFMKLGPYIDLPKQWWTRGLWLWGSPGSGKTVILLDVIQQLLAKPHAKSIIHDVKGDITTYFLNFDQSPGGDVALLCPWDRRSLIWDIARDVRTPSQAAVFAESVIQSEGDKDKFWINSARGLLEGTLRSLITECDTDWGFTTLRDRLAVDANTWAARMDQHHPAMKALVADGKSQQVQNILGSLAAYTRIIDDLATAWGDRVDGAGRPRPTIAFTEWAKDSWGADGARVPRHIIMQSGPSRDQTRTLFGTILKVLTPELVSPRLADNEQGRHISLVLDEAPALGKLDWRTLIELGRSKGIMCLGVAQTPQQMMEIYGPEFMRGLGSMIGMQLFLRMSPSEGRDQLADTLGKGRWAITAVNTSAQGTSTSVHEEMRNAVTSFQLGTLGFRKFKKTQVNPMGWGIRAIVSGVGPDHLMLDFPGIAPTKRRTAHKPAAWTLPKRLPAATTPEGKPAGPVGTEEQRQAHLAVLKALYDEDQVKAKAREAREEEQGPGWPPQSPEPETDMGARLLADWQARMAQANAQATPEPRVEPEESPVLSAVVGAALDVVQPGLGHVAHGLELLDAATSPVNADPIQSR